MLKEKAALIAILVICSHAHAHFQVLVPSPDAVNETTGKTVHLDVIFTHPMEQGPVMEMGQPRQFGVLINGEKHDLAQALTRKELDGKTAYTAEYTVKAPAAHIFYIEPAPYWEPAEQIMIVHYTKVVVDAFSGEGWDSIVGFPVEIQPLVRPYGLWTGNVFTGIVRLNGKPAPYCTVEVEYFNSDKTVKPPSDAFVTQVIKTDQNGLFTYAMPKAGWWGFSALPETGQKIPGPDGQPVDAELAAVIWVKTVDMD